MSIVLHESIGDKESFDVILLSRDRSLEIFCVAVDVGDGEVLGEATLMVVPLSHISFFPLLMQVNFFPE
jgi:hypothetical protein